MNRKSKFRGKNSKDEWVYGSLIINETENEKGKFQVAFIVPGLPCDSDGGDFYTARMERVKIETIGQYTGLHDKNGKEIFEGDIVEMIRPVEKSRKCMLTRHIVTCHSVCDWVFESLAKEVLGLMMANNSDFDSYRFEVIGNVFDNPELAQPYSLNLPERNPRQRRRNNNVEIEIVMGDVKASTTVSQELAQELVKQISK